MQHGTNHHNSSSKKAIIIGAGIAGLASAIRLAVKGFEVAVFEKNNYPGGKLTAFDLDGFRFDAGPSLFTQPGNIEELFATAKEPIEEYFAYSQVPVVCKYFFENGKQVEATVDREQFAVNMQNAFGEDPNAVREYLLSSEKTYKNIGAFFVNHSLHKCKTYFNRQAFRAFKNSKFNFVFKTLHNYNRSKFRSAEAVQIFDRYGTYNGSNPYKAPSMLSLIPHLEMNEGAFYPRGGMISITNALYALAQKKGVQFYFNKGVNRIIHHEGRVAGVVADGQNCYSDIVVSNCDVYFTYKQLLNDEARSKKILKQERSSSALIFYWGINKTFEQLRLHNILFSNNYKAEFDHIFSLKTLYDDPTVYINITAKMEDGYAPAGNENWFVMINVPANAGQDWESIKLQARKSVIKKINRLLQTDIEPNIVTEALLDPIMIETRTSSYMGSLYGTSSNSGFAAFLRHPNLSNTIKGLYFVGGSVHPGGGIPLCLNSAKIMSDMVQG